MNNDFPDRYGHCVNCHKNMLITQVIGGKVKQRLTTDYDETEFLLNDGSKMRVALCKQCKSGSIDTDKIMKSIYLGWEEEVQGLKHWSEEKKKEHLDNYKDKAIIMNSEGVKEDILMGKLKEFNEKEVKNGLNN